MKTIVIFLALTATILAASNMEINALIDAIVTADPQSRYEKVNAFKTKMRALNARQRRQALETLQQRMYPALDPAHAAKTPTTSQHQSTAARSETLQQMHLQQKKMQGGPASGGPKMPGRNQQQPRPAPQVK